MMYAMFWLGEYANILLMCAMGAILFLGGWLPIMDVYPLNIIRTSLDDNENFFLFLLFAYQSNAPRYRFQTGLGWKKKLLFG